MIIPFSKAIHSFRLLIAGFIIIFPLITFSQLPFFEEVAFTYHNSAVRTEHVLKAKDGWMYFGTDQGLFRYDGIVFRKIESKDTLKDENVTALYESSNGNIWVGFRNGLIARCIRNVFSLYKPEEGMPKVP